MLVFSENLKNPPAFKFYTYMPWLAVNANEMERTFSHSLSFLELPILSILILKPPSLSLKGDEIEGDGSAVGDEGFGDELQAPASVDLELFLHSNFVRFLLWVKANRERCHSCFARLF